MAAMIDEQPGLPPFGWYPDPAGSPMLRWWNGSQWTDRLEAPRPEVQPAFGYSTKTLADALATGENAVVTGASQQYAAALSS
jgi:hypothetical protein